VRLQDDNNQHNEGSATLSETCSWFTEGVDIPPKEAKRRWRKRVLEGKDRRALRRSLR
jgi:hypothetical protein